MAWLAWCASSRWSLGATPCFFWLNGKCNFQPESIGKAGMTETYAAPKLNIQQREESLRQKAPGSVSRHERALKSLAGGVSTGLRRSAKPFPLYFSRGSGPY